ncbi:hypothetical protein HDU83_005398 [Entophlyctis luteolus]|nr:hypothetical protein HDU83_005398 [Entophlyctis luteolus]
MFELPTLSQPQVVHDFAAVRAIDESSAETFLKAANWSIKKATALSIQNAKFKADAAKYFRIHPYPLWILESNLFSFVTDVAADLRGTPLLIVNLKHWHETWTLHSLEQLAGFQWALFWVMELALEIPAVKQNGLTIISNTKELNPLAPPLDDIHLMLVEFIYNVIPIKLKTLLVCKYSPKTYRSRAWAFLSNVPGVLKSFPVEMIECNNLEILTYVSEFNLPYEMNGKLPYDHAQWYHTQYLRFLTLHPQTVVLPDLPVLSVEANKADQMPSQSPLLPRAPVEMPSLPHHATMSKNSSEVSTRILETFKDGMYAACANFANQAELAQRTLELRTQALDAAKLEFGTEMNGIELLSQIETDIDVAQRQIVEAQQAAQYQDLLSQLGRAKANWEEKIENGEIADEAVLNEMAVNFLAQIKPDGDKVADDVWNGIVSSMGTEVLNPLKESLERQKSMGKGKEKSV